MAQSQSKQTLFTNGNIFLSGVEPGTNAGLSRPPTFASALLISGSTIRYVGPSSSPDLDALLAHGTETNTVDLAGRTLLPGFVDGHMHFMMMGQSLNKLDLSACKSLSDIQSAISSYAAANPSAPRLLARGWMLSMTPSGVTATDLDGLDGDRDRPVLIDTKDLHFTWCNTAGLKELGAGDWVDVPGGIIQRDEEGKPTGLFGEAANLTYVWPHLAKVASMKERVQAIRSAVEAYHRVGYTGLVDMAM